MFIIISQAVSKPLKSMARTVFVTLFAGILLFAGSPIAYADSTYPGGCTSKTVTSLRAKFSSCISQKADKSILGDFWVTPSSTSPKIKLLVATTFAYRESSATGTSVSKLISARQFDETAPFNQHIVDREANYSFTSSSSGTYYREQTIFQWRLTSTGQIYSITLWSPAIRIPSQTI